MATFLEGAWNVSVVDVESTLRHICKKVPSHLALPLGLALNLTPALVLTLTLTLPLPLS